MSLPCPTCGAAMAAADPVCPSCGQAKARPRAQVSKSDDALQYVKIVGILVVVVVVVLILAGMMGSSPLRCEDCRGKKIITCDNCSEGINRCRDCKGTGVDLGTHSTCLKCNGKGATPSCLKCGGRSKWPCPTCKGTGLKPE
jgi:hypothetical protein